MVSTEVIRGTLAGPPGPDQAAGLLIEAANAGGGPDNVSCVVADIVPLAAPAPGWPRTCARLTPRLRPADAAPAPRPP